MKIFINAGHWDNPETERIEDPGAMKDNYIEGVIVRKIRDELKKYLTGAEYTPDTLPLRETIDWVNARREIDSIAIGIHLNSNSDESINGVQVYYDEDPFMAKIFSRHVSNKLELKDGGAIHDSKTYVGSLGFLRKIKCNSVVVELGYMTNQHDMEVLGNTEGVKKAAIGILFAIEEMRSRNAYWSRIGRQLGVLLKETGRFISIMMGRKRTKVGGFNNQ